jgi:hypothetical protein
VAKKTNPKDLKQLDIIAASRGRDVFVEDKSIESEAKQKKLNLFDFVNDIRRFKYGNMLQPEGNERLFDSFMILRALSMKEDDVLLCNEVNMYTSTLTKEQFYKLLISVIPKDFSFHPWINNKKEDNKPQIQFIAKYFECSEQEALDYLNIMGTEWADRIKDKFGDFSV